MSTPYNQRFWTVWCFLLGGVGALVIGIAMVTLRVIALQRWSIVPGTVVTSVMEGPDSEGSFTAYVTVRWKFKEAEFSNKFRQWGSGGEKEFSNIVARYPQGSTTTILCNPANPSQAYLEAGYRLGFFFAPVIMIGVGLLFAMLGIFLRKWFFFRQAA